MGAILPRPVMTQLLERRSNEFFRVGSCSVNGYRTSMEDAHSCVLTGPRAFCGVFDGHVNDQCAVYVAKEWTQMAQTQQLPFSDERLKEVGLEIDNRFLATDSEAGSTGTYFFAFVKGVVVDLQVGNVGDSRVLVAKNGECVEMTEDHKPMVETERLRIEACNGKVENNRVDGTLAVSRAYGDRAKKDNPNGGSLNQKVIALADVTHTELRFNTDDFAVLACDGVFEGRFTNQEVIAFVAQKLQTEVDLAAVAASVCEEAVERGSKDNISCMIVKFAPPSAEFDRLPRDQFVAGVFAAPKHRAFRESYEQMATKGGIDVGESLKRRFDDIRKGIRRFKETSDTSDDQEEQEFFSAATPDSDAAFFTRLFEEARPVSPPILGPQGGNPEQLRRMRLLQEYLGIPMPLLQELFENDSAQV